VKDTGDAAKERRGRDDALALARAVKTIVVARGKKVLTFDTKGDRPDDETLLAHLLGPTGNLRAPAVRKGQTLLVGFSEEAYRQVLGGKAE
jgi:hypothetical protein